MVKLAIVVLLALVSVCEAHNPLIPDTLYAGYDGHIRRGGGSFEFVRKQALGSNFYQSNITTGSDRACYYYSGATPNDTLDRYCWQSDTLNTGDTRAKFSNYFSVDSCIWTFKMEGDVDSATCGDTLFLIPKVQKWTARFGAALSTAAYNDMLSGVASSGFDTTQAVAIKKSNARLTGKLPHEFCDSLENAVMGAGYATSTWAQLAMLTCADFHIDSVGWAGTDNYIESASLFHDEVTTQADRPYILVYWTDTGAAGGSGGPVRRSIWRGGWR